ncbi:Gfo/Idh/MocA family oxidoreductase [Candidatus Accumulibacter sp. ACC003]|uniref:Gfo/Idh/MocA family protein n=1 Tax=Candidatus Accumulibacter sp. ACC003 TaxID=2823334 RepID=UPI0025B8C912|nr:Gfo/Idh/MocA family oxidoreductase [Candidatus Accumulibacter sp. ACC003]
MAESFLAPLRLGFIGGAITSAVGYTHFNSSRLDGHFRVDCGCFSRRASNNEETARTYGVASERTHATWQQLLELERDALDAIVILTPTPDHRQIAIAALDAGYAVICEKALATSSAECRAIGDAVNRNGGFLAVTYNYSGYPMVRELRQLIANGSLGRIQQIHIEMPQEGFLRQGAAPQAWRLKDYDIPTVSLDLGVHVHHLTHFLTGGQRPLEVVGEQSTYGQFEGIIDNVYCLARYNDELRVQAWYGKTALGYRNGLRIRVFGSLASAEWLQMEPEDLRLNRADGSHIVLDRGSGDADVAQQPRYNRFKAGHPSGFIEAFANLYADIADHLRHYRARQPTPSEFVFGARESEQGLRFLEAISRSARTRQWEAP